jgi:hypothetical protein
MSADASKGLDWPPHFLQTAAVFARERERVRERKRERKRDKEREREKERKRERFPIKRDAMSN